MEMITLVADVGGTQSRLGLAQNGILDHASVRRFTNASFHSFYDVIAHYFKDTSPRQISSCVVALAGPVSARKGTLTNLDWQISINGLRQSTHCHHATLINDLTSLGYSLSKLPTDGIQTILGPEKPQVDNGQYLVVGLGTGFNVCPVLQDKTGKPVCLQVEIGHSLLAHNIKTAMSRQCDASPFNTVEDIFSGKGLSKLYQAISGSKAKSGEIIVEEHLYKSDPNATKTLVFFAELLGLFTRELVLQYLPTSGIFFAGSVSRGIFDTGLVDSFGFALLGQDHFFQGLDQIPVGLITDDAAGLLGCSQLSLQR
jgi:glucokinase